MKLRISCSEGCCCWSLCFVQTELVSIIRSHNSLRHVKGWKKTVERLQVFLVSGQTLFSSPLLRCSHWLPRALQSLACRPSSKGRSSRSSGAGRQVGVCACRQMACSGVPAGSAFTVFMALSCPHAGQTGSWFKSWEHVGWFHYPFSGIAAVPNLQGHLKQQWPAFHVGDQVRFSCTQASATAILQGPPRKKWSFSEATVYVRITWNYF